MWHHCGFAVICGMTAVTWFDSSTNQRHSAFSIPHFTFCIPHSAFYPQPAELWRFIPKWRPAVSWVFTKVKFECISVSGTSFLSLKPNVVWIYATATEIWPLKWIFKIASAAILDFIGSEICRQRKSRLTRVHHRIKFGEYSRVMAIYLFLKWWPAAILDFCRSEIQRYFCFRDVSFSLWAKFCVNMCNSDWVMGIKVKFQNVPRRHFGFC